MTVSFIEVAGSPPPLCGERVVVDAGSARIALFSVDGRMHALEDACLRCTAPLSSGVVTQGSVACPKCGWRYDLATGTSEQVPALSVYTFTVRVEAARVLIEWPNAGA